MTRKTARLMNERVLSGIVVCVRISEVKYAPRMPTIEPVTAPISRLRLARRSLNSRKITATAKDKPTSAAVAGGRLNGLKWKPAPAHTAAKIPRMASMSQKVPAWRRAARGTAEGRGGALSTDELVATVLGTFEGLGMEAPYESHKVL